MNHFKHLAIAALLTLAAGNVTAKDNVDYVDPFIGTTNFSICNPGAIRPHGLMSVVPFSKTRTRAGGRQYMSTTTSISRASHTSRSAAWDVPKWAHF